MKLIIFIISIAFASDVNLQILKNGHSNCMIALESQENIYGIQADLHYNNNEIALNSDAFLLLSDKMSFYKTFNGDGVVQLLILGFSGSALLDTAVSKYSELINITFSEKKEFKGKSIITFENIEIVGQAGMPIDLDLNNDHFIEISFVLPVRTILHDSAPNPFSIFTKINYALSDSNIVRLFIYNSDGELIRKLFKGPQAVGSYNILWDGLGDDDTILPNGHYTLRMLTRDFAGSITMTLLK